MALPNIDRPWQEACAKVQAYRDASINAVEPLLPPLPAELPLNVTTMPATILTEDERQITEALPENLLQKLASGKLTSAVVTSAFLRRAALAHKLTNCLTELLPAHGLQRAKELDDYLAKHGKPIGPLHGLPISVKEHISMKDLDVNASFVAWVGKVAKDDALILKILWEAGAVFHARTTQPQTIMHLETSSNLYGVTLNPFNRNLTAGGSSGGEGALIGLRGSCLGIGTDIGGSIRSPAANNGIFGFKPTAGRLPVTGMEHTMSGADQIAGAIGPMSTSFEGIKIFVKTVINARPWLIEPSLLPILWRESQPLFCDGRRKIKVAVMWDDGVVRPHPPVLRALQEVVSRMRKSRKVEIVEWKPFRTDEAWEVINHLYWPDAGASEVSLIEGVQEPWMPLSRWILKDNPLATRLDVEGVWQWVFKREYFRTKYAEFWNSSSNLTVSTQDAIHVDGIDGTDGADAIDGCSESDRPQEHSAQRDTIARQTSQNDTIDIILCPAGPGAAPPLDCSRYWGYTSIWNLVNWPALVFPVSVVDQEKDVRDDDYVPRNEQDKYNHELYTGPEQYKDAPVCLQLVCRHCEDEKLLECYEYLRDLGVLH